MAPLLPHLAEDAWENLPWPVPTKSVFQAGWFQPSADWTSLAQVCHNQITPNERSHLIKWCDSRSLRKSAASLQAACEVWGEGVPSMLDPVLVLLDPSAVDVHTIMKYNSAYL